MTTTVREDRNTTVQKGLSEWWSKETEYMFQRIERWAVFARGYNRLQSQRSSKDCRTMQEQQRSFGKISVNNTFSTYCFKRSRQKSCSEENKINCCGTFNYQSNSKLDSNCLETYKYDHSIYFKTIGDIKSDKKNIEGGGNKKENGFISSEQVVEWDCNLLTDLTADKSIHREANDNNRVNNLIGTDFSVKQEEKQVVKNAWPTVARLDLDLLDNSHFFRSDDRNARLKEKKEGNSMDYFRIESANFKTWNENNDITRSHERTS